MENNFEKPGKRITRREFLVGGLATAAAAVGITKYGGKILEKLQPSEIIENHEGTGTISKKIHTPAQIHATLPMERGVSPLLNHLGDKPETWSVEVKIDGRILIVPVSKEQFDTLIDGSEYAIVYKTEQKNQQGWVDSIAGVKVKY